MILIEAIGKGILTCTKEEEEIGNYYRKLEGEEINETFYFIQIYR